MPQEHTQCIIHYSTIAPADERLLAYYLIAFCEILQFFSRKKSTEDEPLFLEVALIESDCLTGLVLEAHCGEGWGSVLCSTENMNSVPHKVYPIISELEDISFARPVTVA